MYADKQESSLQIDTMIFDGDGQALPKFPKKLSLQYLKKEFSNEIKFFACSSISKFPTSWFHSVLWASKFPTKWCYHFDGHDQTLLKYSK